MADANPTSAVDAQGGPLADTGLADPFGFSSCSLLSDPSRAPSGDGYAGIATAKAECNTITVPLLWRDPTGAPMQVFVKRYPAAEQPAKGQLWLLSGGPGAPGSTFEAWAFRASKELPALDIYMPDYRGTGKSGYLSCADASHGYSDVAAAAKCAKDIPHLELYDTTSAARDLGLLIDVTRKPSQSVFVYGEASGTYWAARYLQVRPEQPTAVILDSTIPSAGMDMTSFDQSFDGTARGVLELCKKDATCSAKLAGDPIAKTEAALAAVDAGTCKLPSGVGEPRGFLGSLIDLGYFDRLLLPASVYRILRCSDADLTWLSNVAAHVVKASARDKGFSDVIEYTTDLSDFWTVDKSPADLATSEQALLAHAGAWLPTMARLSGVWPAYQHDEYWGKWPSAKVPVLVVQGGLDPSAPFADVVRSRYSGAQQYFVTLPTANQKVVRVASPMKDSSAPSCGLQIVKSFVSDPTRSPDVSCTDAVAPLDFGNPPATWLSEVGIQGLWDDP